MVGRIVGRSHLVCRTFGIFGQRRQARKCRGSFFPQRSARHDRGLLLQVIEPRRGMQLDRAAVGRLPAGEDRQQRRLAGAVGPDQPDLLAGTHLEGDPVQDRLRPEMLGDVDNVEQDHGWRLTVNSPGRADGRTRGDYRRWPRIAERASRGRVCRDVARHNYNKRRTGSRFNW